MPDEILFRPIQLKDAETVSLLAIGIVNTLLSYEYSEEGIVTFEEYLVVENFRKRLSGNCFGFLAECKETCIGMIEIRDYSHVSLLFVDPKYHRLGIARRLIADALAACLSIRPDLESIAVKSSGYAQVIYAKLGFKADGEMLLEKGIRSYPMRLSVEEFLANN